MISKFYFHGSCLLCCDDSKLEQNPAGTLCGLTLTDSTEDGDFHLPMMKGLPRCGTRWARVKLNPRLRELI